MVFEASSNLIRTFSDLRQHSGARYAEHDVIGRKPQLEFLGPGLEEITFKVQLMSWHGVDPDRELKALQEMRDSGGVGVLIFGETKIGRFVLADISSEEGPRKKDGSATWIDVDLTIKEYDGHGRRI